MGLKDDVLKRLEESRGIPVSGEELAQEHGIHDEDPDADFTLDTLEEAADAAGELHSEWDFETEDSEGTDSGEESGTDQNTENSENGSSESENTDPGINEQ